MSHGEMEGDGVDVAWLLMILNLTTLFLFFFAMRACLKMRRLSLLRLRSDSVDSNVHYFDEDSNVVDIYGISS
jgi:hypothetical protein